MKIAGLQKMTLIDYPGKIATTIFTQGCNFRCPFCHNPELLSNSASISLIPEDDILEFLEKRKKYLDAVCLTGGEPLLQVDILEFIKKIKDLGYLIKLDTNGSNPTLLKELVEMNLLDYVAMDIKAPLDYLAYKKVSGLDNKDLFEDVKKSVKYLLSLEGELDYEFRTTVVPGLVKLKDIETIASQIKNAKRYSIQQFINSNELLDKRLSKMKPYQKENLELACEKAKKYVKNICLKNI